MGIGYGCIAFIKVLWVLKDCGGGLLMAVVGYSNDPMLRLIAGLSFINWTIVKRVRGQYVKMKACNS